MSNSQDFFFFFKSVLGFPLDTQFDWSNLSFDQSKLLKILIIKSLEILFLHIEWQYLELCLTIPINSMSYY